MQPVQKRRKAKREKLLWGIVCILCTVLLIVNVVLYFNIKHIFPDALNQQNIVAKDAEPAIRGVQQNIQNGLAHLQIKSAYGLLIDLKTETVLYDKQSNERLFPASMTKVLSALTALDTIHNLTDTITITADDISGLAQAKASVAGLQVGDSITYEQLLYALILPSGADAANALAAHVGGGTKQFVADMNRKAQAMGMKHSNFTNTTGLHHNEHYTTLQDMRRMMVYAWRNPALNKVLTTIQYTIPIINTRNLTFSSTLYTYTKDLSFVGGKIIGGKSGYTPEAGSCLISIGELNNGHRYMFISAQAPGKPSVQHFHMNDAKLVYSTLANLHTQE